MFDLFPQRLQLFEDRVGLFVSLISLTKISLCICLLIFNAFSIILLFLQKIIYLLNRSKNIANSRRVLIIISTILGLFAFFYNQAMLHYYKE